MEKYVFIVIFLTTVLSTGDGNIGGQAPFQGAGVKKGEAISNAKSEVGIAAASSISKTGGNAIANALNGTLAIATAMAKKEGHATATATGHGANGTKANAMTTGTGDAKSSSHTISGGGGATSNSIAQTGKALANAAVGEKDPEVLKQWELLFGKPYED